MGISFALIVLGALIFGDRMGAEYGLKEGWPWVVVALGMGGLYKNKHSVMAWVTTVVGVLIVGARFYSIHIAVPELVKTYFAPAILILIGLLCFLKFIKD